MTLLHKIHSNIIHVRPKGEQSKCLSIGKWIKKISIQILLSNTKDIFFHFSAHTPRGIWKFPG